VNQQYSPYQAPQAAGYQAGYRAPAPGYTFQPLGSGLRKAFGAVIALAMLAFVGSIGSMTAAMIINPDHPPDALMGGFIGGIVLAVLLLYAQIFIGLFWIYKVWSWLPEDQRWSKHWKGRIEPMMAAGMMMIPYFHYYWMFVIDCGICDAMDRMRVQYPTSRMAPKQLAIAACICQLIIPMPVGSILWFMFMSRIEAMTKDMAAAASQFGAPGMGPAPQY